MMQIGTRPNGCPFASASRAQPTPATKIGFGVDPRFLAARSGAGYRDKRRDLQVSSRSADRTGGRDMALAHRQDRNPVPATDWPALMQALGPRFAARAA